VLRDPLALDTDTPVRIATSRGVGFRYAVDGDARQLISLQVKSPNVKGALPDGQLEIWVQDAKKNRIGAAVHVDDPSDGSKVVAWQGLLQRKGEYLVVVKSSTAQKQPAVIVRGALVSQPSERQLCEASGGKFLADAPADRNCNCKGQTGKDLVSASTACTPN
jgi:hypothetical protein